MSDSFFDKEDIVEESSGSFFDEADVVADVKEPEAPLDLPTADMTPSQIDEMLKAQGVTIKDAPREETELPEDLVTSIAGGTGLSKISAGLGAATAELLGDKPLLETSPVDAYYEGRDEQRLKEEELFDKSPGLSIAGGIGGGLLTGGVLGAASKAGKLGKVKTLLDTAKKHKLASMALGGAAAGVTEGESRLLEGEVAKAGKEALTGAALGAAAGKGLEWGGKALSAGAESLKGLVPKGTSMGTSFKYGLSGKDLTEEQVSKDLNKLSKNIHDYIYGNLKKLGASKDEIKVLAKELGESVNAGKNLDETYKEVANKLNLATNDLNSRSKLLAAIEVLKGETPELNEIVNKTEVDIMKRRLLDNSQEIASKKIDKRAASKAIKQGKQPEIGDTLVEAGDESLVGGSSSIDTMGKQIVTPMDELDEAGNVIGETMVKRMETADATPFQPSKIRAGVVDGRPVASYKDLGTGKVTAKIGKEIPKRSPSNPEKLSLDQVDNAIDMLNDISSSGKEGGGVIGKEAKKLAVELRDLYNKKLEDIGGEEAKSLNRRMSKLMSAREELGIMSVDTDAPSDVIRDRRAGKIRSSIIGEGDSTLQNRERASEYLDEATDGQYTRRYKPSLDRYKKLKRLSNENQEGTGISKDAMYRFASGTVPSKAGKAVYNIKDTLKNFGKDPEKSNRLAQSLRGAGDMGNKWADEVLDLANQSSDTRSRTMFSLMQNPLFREHINKFNVVDED